MEETTTVCSMSLFFCCRDPDRRGGRRPEIQFVGTHKRLMKQIYDALCDGLDHETPSGISSRSGLQRFVDSIFRSPAVMFGSGLRHAAHTCSITIPSCADDT